MLKWMGLLLFVCSAFWIGLNKESLSWLSVGGGACLAMALFALLYAFATPEQKSSAAQEAELRWQKRLEEEKQHTSHTLENLKLELEQLRQKIREAEEKTVSYQKLVEVHEQEIEKLRSDNHTLGDKLMQKEGQYNELYLSQMEPDLFDTKLRQAEGMNRQLKQELLDAKSALKEKKGKKNSNANSQKYLAF